MSRIMVVDDEKDILFVIGKILEKNGHEALKVESGEEAMEILKSETPDLILLDVMMPGLDGWEVCSKVKSNEKLKNIPVVMLTAKTSDEDKLKALEECGANWHISKPIDKVKFLDTVTWMLDLAKRGKI